MTYEVKLLGFCGENFGDLTFTMLVWRIWRAPNNTSRWQTGFNSAFKGLKWRGKNNVYSLFKKTRKNTYNYYNIYYNIYINIVRECCYVITVHSCLETAVNAFLFETEALVDKFYSTLKFCPYFVKQGTIHKTIVLQEKQKKYIYIYCK